MTTATLTQPPKLNHARTPILDRTPPVKPNGKAITMRLYEPINAWGQDFGVSAQEFTTVLDSLEDDVEQINLHINSPGGDVWEGLAILNALRQHDARVAVTVDGLAGSSASWIAMAGDEVIMARNSELMIHDPSGLVIGDASDMQDMFELLNKEADNIAAVYAERAGGSVGEWRQAMRDETWYSADEAVAAGLADRVEEKADSADVKNRFDLSIFNHAGRADAPAPKFPTKPTRQVAKDVPVDDAMARVHNASIRGKATPKEGDMQFTDEQMSELRTKLGITDEKELEPAMVLAALGDQAPQDGPDEDGAPAPKPNGDGPSPTPAVKNASGTVTVDQGAWDEREERIRRLEADAVRRRRDERDNILAQAVQDGKFPPARTEHWKRLWDADPEGTREVVDGLTRNVVPVSPTGYEGGPDDPGVDEEYSHLFPPEQRKKGA